MSDCIRTPWRGVWLPRVVTLLVLIVGLPLFLRSPPWCDITLYLMAARNLLHGGVHYQHLFDTNLPGFVWAMTLMYWLFGPSAIAVRTLDLTIVLGVVLLIDRLAKWGGASSSARWWAFAGAAMFYLFTVEMSHAQRDTWMALPGLAAVVLRMRRGMSEPVERLNFRQSVLEGVLWGMGVWLKPHIALMALTVWLLSAWRLASGHSRPWRAAGVDLLGNLVGGLLIAVPGIVWLVASGAWSSFLDVFLNWNPHYMKLARNELEDRLYQQLHWFPIWSMGLIVTVPLAIASVVDSAFWRGRQAADTPTNRGPVGSWLPSQLWDPHTLVDTRFVRGILSGLYLAWAAQSFFLQRGFVYVHVPEVLLMIGLWASHRWAWVPIVMCYLAISSSVWLIADLNHGVSEAVRSVSKESRERYLPRYPMFDPARLQLWPECWRVNLTDQERYRLWDQLRLYPPHEASISWEEMAEVADYLRAQGVSDGEVLAWFDSPHAVYLLLDIDPAFRFMHVYTAIAISESGIAGVNVGRRQVMEELQQTHRARFVINDLEWAALIARDDEQLRAKYLGPPRCPPHDLLPVYSPYEDEFPFNQPTVFRTRNGEGRYIVHRLIIRSDNNK